MDEFPPKGAALSLHGRPWGGPHAGGSWLGSDGAVMEGSGSSGVNPSHSESKEC